MPIAETKNLTVAYGKRTAVSDLSVSIPEGCVGLLGPNGAGKSTLIKTLLGFVTPKSGSATVLGLNCATQGLAIRQKIGLMPEQDCHIPGMNAVTFISYAGELAGMPGAQAIQRAHETLEYCGLGEARYRNVETYSTGMKQRIKLAQALVHGPKLLMLDEPTNGLDPAGREEMLTLIRDISRSKGISVLVSSHLLPDIERTCDAVVLMRNGRVVSQGTVADLRRTEGVQVEIDLREATPLFVAELQRLGATVTNQLGARLRAELPSGTYNLGKWVMSAAKASGAQVRGFRPATRSLEDVFLEAVD